MKLEHEGTKARRHERKYEESVSRFRAFVPSRYFIVNITILLSSLGFSHAAIVDSIMVYTPQDRAIFNDYIATFGVKRDLPMNQLVLETGFYFLETPYVNYTLEATSPNEKLIINLRELDCTTFTETCLALARTLKSNDISFERYAKELMNLRFRGGILDGYASRLHYFSEWLYDNVQLGTIEDITLKANGINFPVTLNLMTRVAKNYPQLADTTVLKQISDIEAVLSNRKYYYIPKDRLHSAKPFIQDGDILSMTVSGKGMDIMHMGFAVHIDDKLHFIHASSTNKRVVITQVPFEEYLTGIKQNTGIMIARPLEMNNENN